MAPITGVSINSTSVKYLEMFVFIFLSVVNTVLIKFNFLKKQEKHMFAYIKYNELI